ncbi:MAG: kelch repeat-containing protein [Polyangiaceae bacterium]
MRDSILVFLGVLGAGLWVGGCGEPGPGEGTGGDGGGGAGGGSTTSATDTESTTTETEDPLGPWAISATTVDGLPFVWGGMVAQESAKVAYLAGGVGGTNGPVTGKVVRLEQGSSGVTATEVTASLTARYCGCAMVDASRKELIVLGGRGAQFNETKTAELVHLDTGEVEAFDAGETVAHPVGCHAVFLADRDEGYVFGGAGQGAGFSASTYRYDPKDHTLTLLDGSSPPARYDGALRYPEEGGAVWLAGGMGLSGSSPKFYSDVWKLDPATGTWSEIATSGAVPPGRRLPWIAFEGGGASMVMGFGSDSAMGATMLGDLWRLDPAAGTWSEVELSGEAMPGKVGFALWLPGPAGSAGLLSGGLGELGLSKQAFVLEAPGGNGGWR